MTDLRVQLYKKRQQQQRVESDQDSLENAEIFSSDEGEDEFQQSQKYSPGANRVVKKSPGRNGNKRSVMLRLGAKVQEEEHEKIPLKRKLESEASETEISPAKSICKKETQRIKGRDRKSVV